ncbi:MAG: RNA 2',3'-cyclic phosphodiesterase [Actinomycetales bacterium]|nr:RNA 2',3'-cyclic phosphodiesterase [Actinomycetales bacterium]
MRVFAAIRPSPQALEHLDSALQEVRDGAGLTLRWGDPEQWHLTLAFHPDLPEGAVPATLEDRRRRRAHLTVGRLSARAPRAPRRRRGEARPPDPSQLVLSRAVHALSVYRGPAWDAEEVELLSSHLGQGRSGGPRHELLGTVPLGG